MTFVIYLTNACTNKHNIDDILKTIELLKRQIPPNESLHSQSPWNTAQRLLLTELYRALKVDIDRAMNPQPELLLRHLMVQPCFSLQAALGYSGEFEARSLSSKLAWTLLNLRSISMTLAFAFHRAGPDSELYKPGNDHDLLGLNNSY